MGRYTLRITIDESEQGTVIKLEGRVAGPWAAELARTWKERGPSLSARKLSLDLRGVTFTDASGTTVLREIYEQTGAEVVAGSQWANFLAEEVKRGSTRNVNQE